jgi:hypothetical protein
MKKTVALMLERLRRTVIEHVSDNKVSERTRRVISICQHHGIIFHEILYYR